MVDLEEQPQYQNLTVTPLGEFIIADYYQLFRIRNTIKDKELIEIPVPMDMIRFHSWTGNKLHFSCDEFLNWERHLEMELDGKTYQITIKNAT